MFHASLRVAVFAVVSMQLENLSLATESGAIEGRLLTVESTPVTDASVTLAASRRRQMVDVEGRFRFEGVAVGEQLLEINSRRLGSTVERVVVEPDRTATIEVTLDISFHNEEVTVSAQPMPRETDQLVSPVSVLSGFELQQAQRATLGDTLSSQAGVNATSFTRGASRPIVRGLGGDRVAMLQDGLPSGDVSTTSPDHAVGIDPASAERVEVLRGPATLMYGSSAVGGAVNVLDDTIPSTRSTAPLSGFLDLGYGSGADERAGSFSLTGGAGAFAWHLHRSQRDAENYEISGFQFENGSGSRDRLPNSAVEADDRAVGLSYVAERGFVGVSVARFDTTYGIPSQPGITVDLERKRFDVRGELFNPVRGLSSVRVRSGIVDYQHVELEGSESGTTFDSERVDLRVEAIQKQHNRLSGAFGLQFGDEEIATAGAEGFLPPATARRLAVFALQELRFEPITWQIGGRVESRQAESGDVALTDTGVSFSSGLVRELSVAWSVGASLAYSSKLPNLEELFSNGPHAATGLFEIGSVKLDQEASLGLELSARRGDGPVRLEVHLFHNRFSDFIYDRVTRETREVEIDGEIEEFPVARSTQADATFTGAELHADLDLVHAEPHHLSLEVSSDWVRAEFDDGTNLPRIPAARLGLGLRYASGQLWASCETRHTFQQDRLARLETETSAFTFWNAAIGYRWFGARSVHDLMLRGLNLTDEDGRVHSSFTKRSVPLPGRDLLLNYRISF
jgi:iron complex outermembrane receptor protein